jgi:NAD(P)H-nitrite reductase large subunit
MERQLDKVAGGLLQESLEERGMKFLHAALKRKTRWPMQTAVSAQCVSRTAHSECRPTWW